jgi:hypothetical protein
MRALVACSSCELDDSGVVKDMREKVRRGVLLIGILAGLACQISCTGDNPLLGSWRHDNNKTLMNMLPPADGSDELRTSASKARAFVEAQVTKLRTNVVLTYREHECEQIIFADNGEVLTRETFPYRLVEVRKDHIIIDQLENGGIAKLFREGDDSMYVEVQAGSYKYKDYFTKQR